MPVLFTPRLVLRQLAPGDIDAVQSYVGVPENVQYLGWSRCGRADCLAFLLECAREGALSRRERRKYDFALVSRETGGLIGSCGIHLDAEARQGALGWILHRDFWRRGLCTEAARELLRFGFAELRLNRLTAVCDAENAGSRGVMEKLGMRREARRLYCARMGGSERQSWRDEYQYAISESEYYA